MDQIELIPKYFINSSSRIRKPASDILSYAFQRYWSTQSFNKIVVTEQQTADEKQTGSTKPPNLGGLLVTETLANLKGLVCYRDKSLCGDTNLSFSPHVWLTNTLVSCRGFGDSTSFAPVRLSTGSLMHERLRVCDAISKRKRDKLIESWRQAFIAEKTSILSGLHMQYFKWGRLRLQDDQESFQIGTIKFERFY